jgi:pyridoxamine 5'-phosphate oxidase
MRLNEHDLAHDWLTQFRLWLADAEAAELAEPTAMVLATASPEGTPGARTVLLKSVDERGFAFFTNYGSRKGRELDSNPRAALVFPWHELGRQVIVDGAVERLTGEESDDYFRSRPYGSRLAAVASRQSSVIESREELERRFAELAELHPEEHPLPRPEWWGGFRLVPSAVEFWQHGANRLHDRLRFRLEDGERWVLERLAP